MKVRIILAVLALGLVAPSARAQEVLYAAEAQDSSSSDLSTLNPSTGAVVTTIGPIGFGVTGLAVDPATGTLYGSTTSNELITINKTTGAGTVVGPLTFRIPDITFTADGTLYGFTKETGSLVTINKATGAVTNVGGPSGITGQGNGLAASAAGVLFLSSEGDDGPLRTISRVDGSTTIVATMNGTGGANINALAFSAGGTLYGSTSGNNLITINTATGAVTVLGPSVNGIDAIVFDGALGAAIPTLSEWLLALLALTLGGIGFFMFRPR